MQDNDFTSFYPLAPFMMVAMLGAFAPFWPLIWMAAVDQARSDE